MGHPSRGSFRNKRDPLADWIANDPVLGPGVIAITEETGHFKIGNGISHWSGLPSHMPTDDIMDLVAEYIDDLPSGEVTQQDLTDHIDSTTPHPNYDDGRDLTVIYENVKAG